MVSLSEQAATSFLKTDKFRYLGLLVSLNQNGCGFPSQLLADAVNPSVLVQIIEYSPSYVVAEFTGYDEAFTSEVEDWLRQRYQSLRLVSHNQGLFTSPTLIEAYTIADIRRTPSLVCRNLDDVAPVTEPRIRTLTIADRSAADLYQFDRSHSGPSLAEYLQDETMKTYAVESHGDILAALVVFSAFEDVWDVEFIDVRDDQRNQGLATQLAAFYARDTLLAGQIPYYSGAANPVSEKTALKAGFACCNEVFSTDAVRK